METYAGLLGCSADWIHGQEANGLGIVACGQSHASHNREILMFCFPKNVFIGGKCLEPEIKERLTVLVRCG